MNRNRFDADKDVPAGTGPEADHTQRMCASFIVGEYLAVNALRDMYLLVEGPDCAHIKTQFVQGSHDWMSELTSVSGFHRIANTALHPDQMSASREEKLRESLLRLASHPRVPALALTSMPMAFVTGADYERLTVEVSEQSGKPVLHVPGKSLSGDWLDGYAEVLHALASRIDLQAANPDPERVAVVGYLFDRNEGDHTANVAEIKRALQALGLDPVSIWLCGQSYAELSAVRDAGTIISFPYGRRAARKLARRTGARLVETRLPFGLPAVEEWMRQLGEAFDRRERAEAFIDAELSRVIPRLEWVIPFLFQNRRLGYIGDPHLLPGLMSYAEMLGASLSFAVITNRPEHTRELPAEAREMDLLVYPKAKTFSRFLASRMRKENLDALVASDAGHLGGAVATLEIGFPSPGRHALYERPFLGFGGALAFADSLADRMHLHAASRPHGRRFSRVPE